MISSFLCILLRADIGGTLLVETELIPVFESMLQVRDSYLLLFYIVKNHIALKT